MTTIDELKRKEKKLSMLLRVFVALLVLIGLFLIGFMISFVGQENASMTEPVRKSSSMLLRIGRGYFIA